MTAFLHFTCIQISKAQAKSFIQYGEEPVTSCRTRGRHTSGMRICQWGDKKLCSMFSFSPYLDLCLYYVSWSFFCFWCVKKLSIAAKTGKSQQKAVKLDLVVSQPSLRKLPYFYAFLYLCAMCQLQSEGFDFVFSLFICVRYTENHFRWTTIVACQPSVET